MGDRLTAADVHLWVTLRRLDTVHRPRLAPSLRDRVDAHPALRAYVRGLSARPEFARCLRA